MPTCLLFAYGWCGATVAEMILWQSLYGPEAENIYYLTF